MQMSADKRQRQQLEPDQAAGAWIESWSTRLDTCGDHERGFQQLQLKGRRRRRVHIKLLVV